MKYLLSNLPLLNQRLQHHSNILLFLDYDGTTVPIHKRPSQAILSPARRQLLKMLSMNPRLLVGIITGRSLIDIRSLVALKDLFYIANHGLEILSRGKYWAHPRVERLCPLLKEITSELRKSTREINGVLLEDKGLTLSIHYRNVDEQFSRKIETMVESAINPLKGKFIMTHGKKVYDIRPNINWDKGKGLQKLVRLLNKKGTFKIYIGDDRTDEDAFQVMGKEDFAIRVGYKRSSLASYYLKDLKEVVCFLQHLTTILA